MVPNHSSDEVPELRKTIESHLWLANVAASSQNLALKPPAQNPAQLTAFTKAQFLDAQTQLEAACGDRHLTKMLKGVVTNMHCLACSTTYSCVFHYESE